MNLILRNLPEPLHAWLRAQASAHHRSLNKEVIAMLDTLRKATTAPASGRPQVDELMSIALRCATLPERDRRTPDEIVGYDGNGLPD